MTDMEIFWHYFSMQYIIAASICGIVFPFFKAYDAWNDNQGYSGAQFKTMKNYLTYGHIMFGLLMSIIPVINIFVAISCIWDILMIAIKDLDKKTVFKERLRDR